MGVGEEDGDAEEKEEGDGSAGQQDLSWTTDC